ncbi:inositol monophosphatase family protein [Buchnera aphidicola]|uniref:inositol monophosphatase family protein n=1 Tax=Buchnera aphidicola TaxID=9 RepID=UPI002092542F|nr:inositol monophosphatase family protein [Buchnera aphidicola]USS94317.1 inositol monophosphatase [Buchnera aphidicola (Sipha maydis)]WII23476.1 inositol monophosphatase family protein [Buchnera aphidicola (Sipha maydis)]
MYPILNIAIQAARQGGNQITQSYDKKIFDYYENKNFLNKKINIANNSIIELIKKFYPQHHILTYKKNLEFKKFIHPTWIINVLHGKKNFTKRYPIFCISIVIFIKNKISFSVIYDPLKNEIFTAVRGNGAQVNGYRMRCSKQNSLKNSFLSLKIKNIFNKKNKMYLNILKEFFSHGVILRNSSVLALDLAYLADGRIDFILEKNFKINNYYSGILQIKESGGIISDYHGGYNYNNNITIIANNVKFIKLIISKIKLIR